MKIEINLPTINLVYVAVFLVIIGILLEAEAFGLFPTIKAKLAAWYTTVIGLGTTAQKIYAAIGLVLILAGGILLFEQMGSHAPPAPTPPPIPAPPTPTPTPPPTPAPPPTPTPPTVKPSILVVSMADCLPCLQMQPIIAELQGEGVSIKAVEVTDSATYNTPLCPTEILYGSDGQEVGRKVGVIPAAELKTWIATAKGAE